MATTLGDLVRARAAERGDRIAITYEGRDISYAELDERASRVANGLLDAGLGPHDHVAFLDKNSPEYFEVLFGGGKVNAINVAVNWRLAPGEMAQVINDSQSKILFVGAEFLGHVERFERELKTVETIVALGPHEGWESYETWVGRASAADPGGTQSPDDVAFQLYTSGTTGLPKGVMLTNDNLFGLLDEAAIKEWGFTPDSVNLVCMPLFHIAGSGWAMCGLYAGGRTVLLREVDPPRILESIPRYGVTHALFVPAVLQFLLATPGCAETDFSSLRLVLYGASPVAQEVLVRSIDTFQCGFAQAYGLTETTGAVTILRPADHDPGGPHRERLRSAGVPFPWVELRVVDPATGRDLPPGEVGEVWIRTRQNMKGYWGMADETAQVLTDDGWLRSGDAGYLDADGYLYIHDRVKDMIISGAENIYPAEVENVLMSHPDVADAAVIGVPDEQWGEAVKALVVKVPGADPAPDNIVGFCRDRIAHYKCPRSVDFVDVLPRNPSGKILKRELREPYWRGAERRVH